MKGVAVNLSAITSQRMKARGLAAARDRADAPLIDVLGLIVRELTGEPPPNIARRRSICGARWSKKKSDPISHNSPDRSATSAPTAATRAKSSRVSILPTISPTSARTTTKSKRKARPAQRGEEGSDTDEQQATHAEAEAAVRRRVRRGRRGSSGNEIRRHGGRSTNRARKTPVTARTAVLERARWDYKVYTRRSMKRPTPKNCAIPTN